MPMWQDSKSRSFAQRQYQGAMSRAQGQHFEDLIEGACEYYRMKGTADIE